MLPPPPVDTLVHIASLAAALTKLNVKIPIEDIIKAIRDEDEAKCAKVTAEATQRRAVLSKLALEPIGLNFTTVSKFVPKPTKQPTKQPTKPAHVDPLTKERRRRLLELTKQAFPDGKVLDPFWVPDVAANKLPFILVPRIVVTSATDASDDPPQSVFENVWCLWDTGAQTSFILTSQLDAAVRDNHTEGSAIMDINFSNVNQTIGSVIHFRPQLPNGVTFIILGQHALLDPLQYQIQPVLINPQLSQQFPEAYGQIDLVTRSDLVNDEVVPL